MFQGRIRPSPGNEFSGRLLGEGISEMISEKVGRLQLQLMDLLRYRLQHLQHPQHYLGIATFKSLLQLLLYRSPVPLW